jgi:hypothetical protein
MALAQGIVGRNKPFAVIDTESGRASHYAPLPGQEPDFDSSFRFDVLDLQEPFRPQAYADAIKAAESYGCIVVDSVSHMHAGHGGLLDWHEEILDKMAGTDFKKREVCAMAAWVKPKMAYKSMMQDLLQVKAHIILCFRAEAKVEMVKDSNGKTVIQPKKGLTALDGWTPVSEKTMPYELTVSFLLTADAPGVPKPIKALQPSLRSVFPLDEKLSEDSGRRIAEWASGGGKGLVPLPTINDDHTIAIQAATTMAGLAEVFGVAQKEARVAKDAGRLARYVQLKEERKTFLESWEEFQKPDSPVADSSTSQE